MPALKAKKCGKLAKKKYFSNLEGDSPTVSRRLLAQGERHFTRVSRPSTYEVVSQGNSERADRFNCVSKTSVILSANPPLPKFV
jgi:hypothetical protein